MLDRILIRYQHVVGFEEGATTWVHIKCGPMDQSSLLLKLLSKWKIWTCSSSRPASLFKTTPLCGFWQIRKETRLDYKEMHFSQKLKIYFSSHKNPLNPNFYFRGITPTKSFKLLLVFPFKRTLLHYIWDAVASQRTSNPQKFNILNCLNFDKSRWYISHQTIT